MTPCPSSSFCSSFRGSPSERSTRRGLPPPPPTPCPHSWSLGRCSITFSGSKSVAIGGVPTAHFNHPPQPQHPFFPHFAEFRPGDQQRRMPKPKKRKDLQVQTFPAEHDGQAHSVIDPSQRSRLKQKTPTLRLIHRAILTPPAAHPPPHELKNKVKHHPSGNSTAKSNKTARGIVESALTRPVSASQQPKATSPISLLVPGVPAPHGRV